MSGLRIDLPSRCGVAGILGMPLGVSILSLCLVFLWQFLTVRYNYGGNWTGLFHTSPAFELPPEPAGEDIYRDEAGAYDGQFYHLIAHDPLLKRGFSKDADNARLRWRRILIPGLSNALALGKDSRVHVCYFALNLLFVCLGAYWVGRYCAANQVHPAWGLSFTIVPAVAVSIDRLTVDSALAALTAGLALYTNDTNPWKRHAVLTIAPLVRETGFCLILGNLLFGARERRWPAAFSSLATAAPFACWVWHVHRRTSPDATPWLSYPFAGIVERTLHPVPYELLGPWTTTAAILDYLALLGIWGALVLAGRILAQKTWSGIETSILVLAFVTLFLGKPDIWSGAYEFGRTLSPLLLLLALRGVALKQYWSLLPIALALPRIALQVQPQVFGILKGLLY